MPYLLPFHAGGIVVSAGCHLLFVDAQGEEDGEDVGTLSLIKSSGERLLTIINDLLDVAKASANQMSLQVAPFSVQEEVDKVGVRRLSKTRTPRQLRAGNTGCQNLCA